MSAAAPARARLARHAVPAVAAILAVATVAVGLYKDANGQLLGVPHPPFIGAWGPKATLWVLLAIPCFAAGVALVKPLLKAKPLVFAAGIFALTLVLRVVLFAARNGGDFDRALAVLPRGEGKNEYLPTLAAFEYGTRFVLDRFAELVPALPVHSAGHPPGLVITMNFLGLDTGTRLAWFCIIVGALSAPLTYVLAKRLFDDRVARIAGVLAAFSPAMLHFGAVSPDAVYLTLGLLAAIPLLSGRIVLGAIALAVVTMFAWSELAIGAWATILVLTRDGFKPALKLAAHLRGRAARHPGAAGDRHRLGPDRHLPRHARRLHGRDREPAPVLVLAARLAHGVLPDPRRADRLARVRPPAATRPRGDRHPRRDRRRRRRRLHEGRDGAHLALPGPARVPRRGAGRPPADAARRRARRAGRGLRAAVRHALVSGAAADEQPQVAQQRPLARRTRRRARRPDRSDLVPSGAVARCTALPGSTRRGPTKLKRPRSTVEQQRELTRARPLEPAPERAARQRPEARQHERRAVAAEPRAPLDHPLASEREQQQDEHAAPAATATSIASGQDHVERAA